MKKTLKLFLLGIVAVGIVWWYSHTSNPWNVKTIGEISAPIGYTRAEGDYAEFMRGLPLKKRGSKVQLYNGWRLTLPVVVDVRDRLALAEQFGAVCRHDNEAEGGIFYSTKGVIRR